MNATTKYEFDAYIEMLSDPDFSDYSGEQFAESLGVNITSIYNWNRKVDWESIKSERRKRYAKLMPKVDNALFKSTQKGDVQAIRTFYERFDAWTPASKVVNEQSLSDADIDEELNARVERKRAALDSTRRAENAPVDSGEVETEAGRADAVLQAQPGSTEVH